jgi:hypothetical protein
MSRRGASGPLSKSVSRLEGSAADASDGMRGETQARLRMRPSVSA